MIGKFSNTKSQNQDQKQPDVFSYVRLLNEEDVYVVDGYLSMTFNRNVEDFRNAQLCNIPLDKITKVSFNYNADSAFVLEKQNNSWTIENQLADSAAVQSYLQKLSQLSSRNFIETSLAKLPLVYSLKIEGTEVKPIEILAYQSTDNQLIVASSANQGTVFNLNPDIISSIFISKQNLK
ncbi:MAG: DUF4340 domain-containing protein [Bacteroidales bacterium]|nr:DUF4340 domain-containing protein [Bacteroidales bacterium]